MRDFGRGLIVGVVAGFVFAIVYSIISIVIVIFFLFRPIAWTQTASFVNDALMFSNIGALLPSAIFSGIVGGIVFGLIYAAVYNTLPGSTSAMKGIMLGTVFWLIFAVVIGYFRTATHYGMVYYGTNVITGLISYLIWGYLVGKLWDKFGGKQPQEYRLKKGRK